MTQWHGGKGSGRRKGTDQQTYADNWDRIFGKKDIVKINYHMKAGVLIS